MPGLERLPVSVSEAELHAIDTVESFEASGRFLVAISNHGRDAHVHLNLDDALARVARVEESNVYVPRDETREVEVVVDPDVDDASGTLTVQTGYGVETAAVAVTVGAPDDDPVRVDERLGQASGSPQSEGEETPDEDPGPALALPSLVLPSGWLSVGVLAVVALALAGATVALVNDPVVVAGVVVVLVGVLAAAVMLVR